SGRRGRRVGGEDAAAAGRRDPVGPAPPRRRGRTARHGAGATGGGVPPRGRGERPHRRGRPGRCRGAGRARRVHAGRARGGRRDLARAFADAYFRAAGDDEGRALLPLYTAYRAAVRGMVDGLLAGEPEVPAADREAARLRSRAYWLLALAELETPDRRPCVA